MWFCNGVSTASIDCFGITLLAFQQGWGRGVEGRRGIDRGGGKGRYTR